MERDKIFSKIIGISFSLLFIIVPLILTPWNYELFEFNKMLSVYALTVIIFAAWLGRMILNKRIVFKKTAFDLPLALFFISQLISTIFSIDRHTSLWGYYSRFHGGLLSTICYLVLYWAFVSNMNKKSTLFTIYSSLFTAMLVSFYGIAEHFGIDAKYWIQDVRTRVFSTLGQPNWLAAYLAILIPLSLGFFFQSVNLSTKNRKPKLFFFAGLYFLFSLCFLYTRSQSGVLGLGVSLMLFWLLIGLKNKKNQFLPKKDFWLFFLVFNFGFLILFKQVGFDSFPQLNDFFKKFNLKSSSPIQSKQDLSSDKPAPVPIPDAGSPTGEIRKIVWKGALAIWRHYPFFGSGVETFAYSYYNFRPVEHNLVSEWDFLYNKAHNEYLNFLSTTGIVGLGSYLIFIIYFIIWGLHQISNIKYQTSNILALSLFTGWISILITNFFGFSVVPIASFFFLIPAFSIVLSATEESNPQLLVTNYPINKAQKISLVALLFFIFYFLFFIFKLWRADIHYAKGEKMNKAGLYDLAFAQLIKAIDLKKDEPVYRNEIAESSSNLALLAFKQKEASSASDLLQMAVSQSDLAIKTSPGNLNFHKGRIKVLYILAQINKNYLPLVIRAFQEAIALAPTDAKLVYNLGTIYSVTDETDLAIESFQKAINLKPNYKEAYYGLALSFQKANQQLKAKEQLEYILKYLDPKDGPTIKLLQEIGQ